MFDTGANVFVELAKHVVHMLTIYLDQPFGKYTLMISFYQ